MATDNPAHHWLKAPYEGEISIGAEAHGAVLAGNGQNTLNALNAANLVGQNLAAFNLNSLEEPSMGSAPQVKPTTRQL